MKTALFSALLLVSSVVTLGLTANQEVSNSIDQIRSEEMVAPGGNGEQEKGLMPMKEGTKEGNPEFLHQV